MRAFGTSTTGIGTGMGRNVGNRRRRRLDLERLETRALLTTINKAVIPTAGATPETLALGTNGDIYIAEANVGKIGVLNPTTLTVTDVPIPTANADPLGMATGPGGVIYFTEPNLSEIGTYNPATGQFNQYPTPTTGSKPELITEGSDGNMYFTELTANQIGVFNTTNNTISELSGLAANAEPYGITSGADGNIYFTEQQSNTNGTSGIGEYNLATKAIMPETPLPTSNAEPFQITPGPDGQIWFTEQNASQLGQYNLQTGKIKEYATGAGTTPSGIVAGPDGLLYLTDFLGNAIEAFSTSSLAVVGNSLPVPTSNSEPFSIVTAPDGNMYFTEVTGNNIGQIVLTQNLVLSTPPPSSAIAGHLFPVAVSDVYATGVVNAGFQGSVTIQVTQSPNPYQTILGGASKNASGGVASFSIGLPVAVANNQLQITSAGFAAINPSPITITPGAATRLVPILQPPTTLEGGQPFNTGVAVVDQFGNVVTNFSGAVDLGLAQDPSGATLQGATQIPVSGGLAWFTGISIASPGTGYVLSFAANGLTTGDSSTFSVTAPPPPPPPIIISEQVVFNRRLNKKGKPIGPILSTSFNFTFNEAMNAATVMYPGNYQVAAIQYVRIKRKLTPRYHALPFAVNFSVATNTVSITVHGRPPLPRGGVILLIASPPSGIQSSAGILLDGNNQGMAGATGVVMIAPHDNGLSGG